MTDEEMTALCAAWMGYKRVFGPWQHATDTLHPKYYMTPKGIKVRRDQYNPLTNGAQCLLLGKSHPAAFAAIVLRWAAAGGNLNRLVVEHFANLELNKTKTEEMA